MNLMLSDGWFCQFLEEDCRIPLRRKLTFANPEKIWELAQRGGALQNLEAKQGLEYGIQIGRGAVWLEVALEQYRKLN